MPGVAYTTLLKKTTNRSHRVGYRLDGFLPQALEQEWTIEFIVENIDNLPTEWIYASLAVCKANVHLSYATTVRLHLEHELLMRKTKEFH